jgi:hypothetical protein
LPVKGTCPAGASFVSLMKPSTHTYGAATIFLMSVSLLNCVMALHHAELHRCELGRLHSSVV